MEFLLDAMGLPQYQTVFAEQCVSGDILVELGDEDLQNDLGITSRIHRIRLRRVITGHYSVSDIVAKYSSS